MTSIPGMGAAVGGLCPPSSVAPITFPGSLGAPAAGVLNPTGTARAATVPAGNSGQIIFQNLTVMGGGGTNMQYNINGAGFVTITEGAIITVPNTQTLQIKSTGCVNPGDGFQVDVNDVTTSTSIQAAVQCYR